MIHTGRGIAGGRRAKGPETRRQREGGRGREKESSRTRFGASPIILQSSATAFFAAPAEETLKLL